MNFGYIEFVKIRDCRESNVGALDEQDIFKCSRTFYYQQTKSFLYLVESALCSLENVITIRFIDWSAEFSLWSLRVNAFSSTSQLKLLVIVNLAVRTNICKKSEINAGHGVLAYLVECPYKGPGLVQLHWHRLKSQPWLKVVGKL